VTDTVRRKLIEVALPLEVINRESAREKSIRHGHPSTMHPWWARRPLAACRAVLFAQLVDDPSARPDEFPTQAAQDAERERLFRLIERLVPWEATTDDEVLAEAHAEILKSCDGVLPRILDPFAGGGSIPLEAQRLGLEAHASDLNPVAVLLTKALIELPTRFAGRPPVNPATRASRFDGAWKGAEGLAEDVRHYGRWMRDEAERRLGHLYPKAELPGGGTATVIAWIWARTVMCPNPACRARMPLVRSFWLGRKKGREAYVVPVVDGNDISFEIGHESAGPPVASTVGRSGAHCVACSTSVPLTHIRAEGKGRRMGAQLVAVAAEGHRQRLYLPPIREHEAVADISITSDVPDTQLPLNPRDFKTPNYGLTHHADLFTPRQLTLLTTLTDLVEEARQRVLGDMRDVKDCAGYADTVATYLALVVSRLSDRHSAQTTWDSSAKMESLRGTFARQAIPMQWDYAESNPFNTSSGNFEDGLGLVAEALKRVPPGKGQATQYNAQLDDWNGFVISTDPPYYDNVGYADLSDYFYVWLRRSIADLFPKLFATLLTPKAEELVANPYRHGGAEGARRHFEKGFVNTFAAAVKGIPQGFPLTLFYAYKQSENHNGSAISTGWETMLESMLSAGFAITGTWPMRTELGNRVMAIEKNALASSIVLACRRRPATAVTTDRRGFVAALSSSLPAALRLLQQGNVAPVDLAQAAIGPGMAIFSSYAKVLEPDGSPMTVRTALGLINRALDEVLAEHEGEFDAATRWAVRWFQEHGYDDGPYGKAETLSTALAVSVGRLEREGLVRARAGKVHLVRLDGLTERRQSLDGSSTAWEVVHHLMKRLADGGEQAAGALLAEVDGLGDAARDLAYRLYSVSDRKGWSASATAFNGLVASWADIARSAREQPGGTRTAGDQLTLA